MHPTARLRRGLAATAAASLTLTGLVSLAPMASAGGTTLVLNEVYGGGGNSGATYTHDFVELRNGTGAALDLTGYTVQYYSAAGNLQNTCTLTGTVAAGDHFLVQQAAGNGGTTPLPTPDQTCDAAMSGTQGSVTLNDANGARLDAVGYGNVAIFEGAPAQGLTNTTSASRTDGVDTDNNAQDFTRGEPTPQAGGGGDTGADHVVINEFYGRGGSTNQPYSHKFVELYNPTDAAFDLTGTSLQYRSATGAGNATGVVTLTGSVAAGGYYLVQLNSNGGTGEALPTPDQVSNIAPSGTTGTVFLVEGTAAANPDDLDVVIDKLGYGGSNSPEGTAAPYPGTNTTPGSLNRTGGVDTDDNAADFTFVDAPTPQNSGDGGPGPDPEPLEVTIAEIQGTGTATPLAGQRVVTEGVVTAAYPTGNFRGVYLQTPGTGGTAKTVGDASDGIFVFSDAAAEQLTPGECVRVEGTPVEFNGLTQLSGSPTFTVLDACADVAPTPLATLPVTDAEKEVYEGMLVHPEGTYTITNNYALNQYGQLGLAVGSEPLYQATDVVEPGPEAVAYEAANQARYITLDDGSSWDYLSNETAQDSPLPYLSHEEPHRTGSQVTFDQPVILDYRFQWNYQPTGQVVGSDSPFDPIVSENDREYEAPEVGGNIQIGAFNVLNYFTDLGQDELGCRFFADRDGNPVAANNCEVRGAWSEAAFADQQAKIVTAINLLDADVLGLQEIEANSALSYKDLPRDLAMADLVEALNEDAGWTRWAYVPSPVGQVPANEDIIRTGFIYNPSTVQLLGGSQILLDDAFANARYPLAQKFKAVRTGKPFVAINNHFKSKSSGADDGTGQGLANPSREAQARALTAWVEEVYEDEAVFLMGDFNAYSRETPVQIIEAAGYTNTAKHFEPESATYQFSGRLGSLDHIFANEKAMRLVTGAAVWDINGDESIAFQYSRRNYNVTDFHRDDQFASSDHDPTVVGLDTGPGNGGPGKGGPGRG